MAHVVALIHGEAGAYGVSFPDFPGATSGGRTIDEVVSRAHESLASHVEALIEEGLPVPGLRTIETLRADPHFAEDFADAVLVVLLSVDLPGRSKRFNISMDESLMNRIDASAAALGETRSGFLASAARRRLQSETS